MFYKKLNYLMNLTNISNVALGKALSLDPSYVSRLRSGNRSLPQNATFLVPLSQYIARKIVSDEQKLLLSEAMTSIQLPETDTYTLSMQLLEWFLHNSDISEKCVHYFLDTLQKPESKKIELPAATFNYTISNHTNYYYGPSGKREAVIRFLYAIAEEQTPQTILLFSDENMIWLTENVEYTKLWSALLMHLLAQGNRIKIIHTISRNIDDIFLAITKWLPIYMSGMVESFYLPKMRDGIFKKTLFIASKTAAVISDSIQDQTDAMINQYIVNKQALASFTLEFNNYLALCRPLMRIFTDHNIAQFYTSLQEFETAHSPGLFSAKSLSLFTMPEDLIDQIGLRIASPDFIDLCQTRFTLFQNYLAQNSFYDNILLPPPDSVKNGSVAVLTPEILKMTPIYYTCDEYKKHLDSIITLLNTNSNYHVTIQESNDNPCWIYAKQDIGVLFGKYESPLVFLLTELNLSSAFWDFFHTKAPSPSNRKHIIATLKKYIRKL